MEILKTGLRGVIRLLLAVAVISAFLVRGLYIKWRHRQNIVESRKAYIQSVQFSCALLLKVFKIEVKIYGAPIAGTNFLYVGNHMGFLDIFVLAASLPALFITSQEMRETPLLGGICEMAGCIFVERRSRMQIKNELGSLKTALEQGFNVVLYPEGTSTNGEAVMPFKKALIMAGPHAGRPIQPGCINFLEIDNEDFNLNTRDKVCWYGEMSFVTAMWNSLTTSSMKAEMHFLAPMHEPTTANRHEVAMKAHALVSAHFKTPRIINATAEAHILAEEA